MVLIGAGRSFIAGADIRQFGTRRPPPVPGKRTHEVLDASAKTAADAVKKLRKAIGLPEGLAAEKVTEADIPKLADKAIQDACHTSNPRPTTRDDLAALYRASL